MLYPANPDVMNPILEFGDHIHPSPFGYLAIGRSVDPSVLEGDASDEDDH
jgi:hypothetical protein